MCVGGETFLIPHFIQAIDESVASMQTVCPGFQAFRLQGDADYAFASMTISHVCCFKGHIRPYTIEQTWSMMHCVLMGSKVLVDQQGEFPLYAGSTGHIGHNGYDLLQKREESSLLQYQGEGPSLLHVQLECIS